jgi:hypothetical protein
MLLAAFGKETVDTDAYTVYMVVSFLLCIIVFIYNTHKNFDVTAEGSLGTNITRSLKAGAIASESVMTLLEESEDVDDEPRSESFNAY